MFVSCTNTTRTEQWGASSSSSDIVRRGSDLSSADRTLRRASCCYLRPFRLASVWPAACASSGGTRSPTHRLALAHFFSKISRLRCAGDLGSGISRAPPCNYSTPCASGSSAASLAHSLAFSFPVAPLCAGRHRIFDDNIRSCPPKEEMRCASVPGLRTADQGQAL